MASSHPANPLPTGRVLDALYAAGGGELGWNEAFVEIASSLGADIVAVFADRPASSRPFACVSNAPPAIESVFASWSAVARHQDPVRAVLDRMPPRAIVRSSDLVSPAHYRASGFYRDYASQFGGTVFMDVDLERRAGAVLNLCVWAQDRPTAFDDATVEALNVLVPHVSRALRLEDALQRAGLRQRLVLAAIDAIGTPVLAVDGRGAVSFANAAATEFLEGDNGLAVKRGILEATCEQHPPLATTLRRLIVAPRQNVGIHTIAVSRLDRGPMVLTVVLPLPSSEIWSETGTGQGALIFVGDPEQELVGVAQDLQRIHGLTEREAEVAISVANGLDPSSIAEHEGVGVDTVRKQLKQAFAKTGTSRQVELARLVLLELGQYRRKSSTAGCRPPTAAAWSRP